jgi:hypothetical protein
LFSSVGITPSAESLWIYAYPKINTPILKRYLF